MRVMTTYPHDLLDGAALAFGLGRIRTAIPVAGGLSNDLWRVETSAGRYAVKVMRTHADRPEFSRNVEAAFSVERRAFSDGVACPEPILAPGGGCLQRVGGRWVRVHRWVEGEPATAGEHGRQAGALLATIHRAGEVSIAALDDEPWDERAWASMAEGDHVPSSLAAALRSAAVELAELEAGTSAAGLAVAHVGSHGDLDPKNTLVVDGRLLALDWDAAGSRSQAREAVTVALDWSSDPIGFRWVLDGYLSAGGGSVPAEPWVLGGWVSALGGWLVHSVEECLHTAQGCDEAAAALDRLVGLHTQLPLYLEALRGMS